MNHLYKLYLSLAIWIFTLPVHASVTAPPRWADAGEQFMYFMTTQGLEWGLGIASVAWGGARMFNLDGEWQKRTANFTTGAGIAFAVPDAVMTLFGRTGYDLQIVLNTVGM